MKDSIEVKEGFVEFSTDHCSEYFLTQTIINNIEETSKILNNIIMVLIFVVIGFIGYTIFKNK